ncbi:Early nodulin-like protein [Thalictrum thalictroides]|uniref:Early nodulin-like protein n=1 Tax=Thalictrum thalictroides TaxID=46969 RepID=A0A7J6W1E1_THATH|nr:Early nodulin-like protein [Thalictrum thalictroides]
MAKLLFFILMLVLGLVLTCQATTYTVGDTSGWDISSNIDSWATDKNLKVGDSLLFLYSSTHSVNEVNKESYDACNVTNPISASSNGNTTITLTTPGNKYFVCGNKLHCFGGMKLQVHVKGEVAGSPASAPSMSPSSLPRPSTKNNMPGPTSTATIIHSGWTYLLSCTLGVTISTFLLI